MGLNAVQSYPAERVLVAALLGRPASFHELGGRVTEEMFTEPGLRLVFRAFAELASRGERIDMATVEAEMFRLDHRLYGELNGVSFLSAMLQAVRNDSHIHEYVRLVQREWMLRGCVASLNKRGLEAQQPDVDVMKLLAGVTDDMDGLREHASGGVDVRMAAEVAREVLARSFRNQEAREKGEHIQVRTGFDELDDLTGGLYRGELAVLSGRPSMGKTAVALHMALQAARAGRNTLYFSIEMSEEEVTERILSMLSGVEAGKIRFKGTNREERALLEKAAAELAGLPLRIVYCGSLAIDEIRAVLMTRKARRELDIFFIDYLNLIHIPYTRGSRNETTDLALGDVVRKVKLMAVELDVPAVLLAQMNRDSDRRLAPYLPILSDLRNSGAIEQVADQVIFVYRAEKYGILYDKDTKEDLRGVGYLLVAKNRNGATGRARFRYNVSMTRFLSYETGCYERRFVERENPSGGHDRGSGGCLCAVAAQRCGICRLVSFPCRQASFVARPSGKTVFQMFRLRRRRRLVRFRAEDRGMFVYGSDGKLAKRYSIDSREWTVDNYEGKKKRTDGKRTAGSSDKTANENSDDQLSVVNSQLSIRTIGAANRLFASLLQPYVPEDEALRETYRLFGVGIAPPEVPADYRKMRSRLIFPIRDEKGGLVAFAARRRTDGEEGAKYVNSPASPVYSKSRVLYALDLAGEAIRERRFVFVTEGYKDALAMHAAGFTNTVALCGVAFTAGHLRLLAGYTQRIVLLLDADRAGEASMEKIVAMLSCGTDPEGERLEPACLFEVSRMQLPYGEDPDSLLHGSGFVSFRRQITASLHLALLETYEHHLLRQIAKTVSDLSLCLSCEDRISLLSLLAKQKSRLSRVTMRLGRNVVV